MEYIGDCLLEIKTTKTSNDTQLSEYEYNCNNILYSVLLVE